MRRAARIPFGVLRAAIGIALLVYLGRSHAIHWSTLLGLTVSWPLTLAALFTLVVGAIIVAWRLCVLLKPRGFHISLSSSFRLTLIGLFFNTCLPGSIGGDVIRIYYAAEGNPGRRTEVATVLLIDRAAGMFALVLWPLLVAPLFPQFLASQKVLRGLLWGAAVIVAAMLATWLVASSSRVRSTRVWVWAFRKLPLGAYLETIFDTVHSYGQNRGALLGAVWISLLAHTLAIGAIMLLVASIHPVGFAWKMSLLIPLGFLANTVPLTPGGLGVGEAAFNQLFALAGLTGGAEALLGWRLLTFLISLTGLVYYLQGRKRFVHAAADVSPSLDSPA